MKVFISWSGETSKRVAVALHDWLRYVIPKTEFFMSSEDIESGARWSETIGRELETCDFGVVCITKDNLERPWLNFEAGALSKKLDVSRLVPVLFGVRRSEVKGPLIQFQNVRADQPDEMRSLVFTLFASDGDETPDKARQGRVFETWWPQLESALKAVPYSELPIEEPQPGSIEANLEEVLEICRRLETRRPATRKGPVGFPQSLASNLVDNVQLINQNIALCLNDLGRLSGMANNSAYQDAVDAVADVTKRLRRITQLAADCKAIATSGRRDTPSTSGGDEQNPETVYVISEDGELLEETNDIGTVPVPDDVRKEWKDKLAQSFVRQILREEEPDGSQES